MLTETYRLSSKNDGSAYTLEQVLALCDHRLSNGYGTSHRMNAAVRELQRATERVVQNARGEATDTLPDIIDAQNHWLQRSCKQLVGLLDEMHDPATLAVDLTASEKAACHRNNAASVQQLMMLLADNAAHHAQQGRSA